MYMSAFDEDFSPNGEPFHFSIISEESTGPWEMEKLNGEGHSESLTKSLIKKSLQSISVVASLFKNNHSRHAEVLEASRGGQSHCWPGNKSQILTMKC